MEEKRDLKEEKHLRKYIKEILIFITALILTGAVCWLSVYERKKTQQYDVVFLGDSIVGNMVGENSITSVLEERLGKRVYNGALGGTCMSDNNTRVWEGLVNSSWSMVRLAQAICAEDFTGQKMIADYAEHYKSDNLLVPDYFRDRIYGLEEIDFSQVEILLIEHGTNDYNSGQKLDAAEDPMDVTTFGGALRTSLTLLQDKYPHLRIILVSPLYCEIEDSEGESLKCYEADFGGGILDDFVALEQEIAAQFGVEWIDLYHGSGIWEDNIDTYLFDKLHPGEETCRMLGNLIADYLEENEAE